MIAFSIPCSLVSSNIRTIKGSEGRVFTNVEYALAVHEGTKFMRGRPFMEQGVQFAQLNLDGEIRAKLDKHLVAKLTKI